LVISVILSEAKNLRNVGYVKKHPTYLHKTGEGQMRCDVCGKEGVRIRRMAKTYGKGKCLLVIEDVPVVNCQHCGESYLTTETLQEIERIKLHRKSLAVKRPVEVTSFA